MSSNIWGLEAGAATKVRDAFVLVDALVAGHISRTKLNGRSLKRALNERVAKAQRSHLRLLVMPVSNQFSLGYTGRADDCSWSSESPCHDPARYEVRDRRGTRPLCLQHLAEHRMAVDGYGPALRQDSACPRLIKA